jgi:hypothetical protein
MHSLSGAKSIGAEIRVVGSIAPEKPHEVALGVKHRGMSGTR